MGQCFSSNVLVLFTSLTPLTKLTQAASPVELFAKTGSSPFSCATAGAGSSDTCIFHCNEAEVKNSVFNCDTVANCVILCSELKCMESAEINAGDAGYLNVTSLPGGAQCFKKADVYLPNYGSAEFTMEGQKAFKNMLVHSGSNTDDIIIDCTYGASDECKGLVVYGANAQYLEITVGASSDLVEDNKVDPSGLIQCPADSQYSGPELAPCIIDLSGGGTFNAMPIETVNGIPADVYIKEGSTQMTGITVTCTVGTDSAQNSFDSSSTCWNSPQPTTNTPSASPVRSPSASPSASPVTTPPTLSPSKQPSTSPTRSPASVPVSTPPTKSPSKAPSTPIPSKSPLTVAPTVSPVELPDGEVNEDTTAFPTLFVGTGDVDGDQLSGGKGSIGPMHVALGGVAGVLICFLLIILWCFCKYKKRAHVASFDETNVVDSSAMPEGNMSSAPDGSARTANNQKHPMRVHSVEKIDNAVSAQEEEESEEEESSEEESSSEDGGDANGVDGVNMAQVNYQNGPVMNNYAPPPSQVPGPPAPVTQNGYAPPQVMNNNYVPPPPQVPGPPASNIPGPPAGNIPGPPAPANDAGAGGAFVYQGGIGGSAVQQPAAPNNNVMKVTPFAISSAPAGDDSAPLPPAPAAPGPPAPAQQENDEEYEYYEEDGQGGGEEYEYYDE